MEHNTAESNQWRKHNIFGIYQIGTYNINQKYTTIKLISSPYNFNEKIPKHFIYKQVVHSFDFIHLRSKRLDTCLHLTRRGGEISNIRLHIQHHNTEQHNCLEHHEIVPQHFQGANRKRRRTMICFTTKISADHRAS